jgi:putative flippase GtrA
MIAVKYAFFAIIAMMVNLLTQFCSDHIYSGYYGTYISLCLGTLVGLLVKYICDKTFIFQHDSRWTRHDLRKFVLYSALGVLTTFVFWGVELAFHFLIHVSGAKFFGGFVGLSIGYFMKYRLDKKYVFVQLRAQGNT